MLRKELRGFQPIPFFISLAIAGVAYYYSTLYHLPMVDGLVSAAILCCIVFAGLFEPLLRWRDKRYGR